MTKYKDNNSYKIPDMNKFGNKKLNNGYRALYNYGYGKKK